MLSNNMSYKFVGYIGSWSCRRFASLSYKIMSYPTKYSRYINKGIPLRKVMEKTNWFRKLTKTNEQDEEYYCMFGKYYGFGSIHIIIIRIDEEVDGLTYYYPRTRGDRRTGESRYFHLPDKDYIEIVGNSNNIEALTKDMRFLKNVKREELNTLHMTFSYAETDCTIVEPIGS